MNELYPIKFKPILKERIWGGNKLKTVLFKKGTCTNCGESWEISAVQDDISIVENGFLKGNNLQDLIEIYMGDLVGDKVYDTFGIEFPLLIKFIDTMDDLSIQVHPNDQLARERHNSYGKTEMWYIMEAETDASLVSGFNKDISRDEYLVHLNNSTLYDILNKEHVRKGDTFFIPAGRVHAIGPGLLLAEIQQTSDVTYRIYDWDRVDSKGAKRELHTELALDAIDYTFTPHSKTNYKDRLNEHVTLVDCPYFTTRKITFNKNLERDYIDLDSFVIYICCKGEFELRYNESESLMLYYGETVLLPACIDHVTLFPKTETELLEIFIK